MDLKQLLNDDDAVSPVIGVILMVAITVILAAVIATFVLGLVDSLSNTAPQASFSFEYTDNSGSGPAIDELAITHDGGDSIPASSLSVRSSAAIGGGSSNTTTGNYDTVLPFDGAIGLSGDVTAGTTATVSTDNSDTDMSGLTIRVVYSADDGSNSATLGRWDGPNA